MQEFSTFANETCISLERGNSGRGSIWRRRLQLDATFGVTLLELVMAGMMMLLFTIMQLLLLLLLLLLLVGKKVSNSNLSVRLELMAKLPPSRLVLNIGKKGLRR